MKEPMRVMIVEDDEIAAEILQQYILHYFPDAEIQWQWDGFEALVRITEFSPQFIFLDYMMPKLDGMEFLSNLRKLDCCNNAQVIVISAYVDGHKEMEFRKMGADEVLAKPVEIETIRRLLTA